jgi:hypothetical protein
MKNVLLVSPVTAAVLLALGAATAPTAADAGSPGAKLSSAPVQTHPSQGDVQTVEGAMAELVTTEDGAFASFSTSGLEPGHAHTMWFVAINDPQACETAPASRPT